MSFTKKPIHIDINGVQPITSVKVKSTSTELDDDGAVHMRNVVEDVPLEDISKKLAAIAPEDYTLSNLIKAGVNLQQIQTKGLLSSSDQAKLEELLEEKSEIAFDTLYNEDYLASKAKKTTAKVETNEDKTE